MMTICAVSSNAFSNTLEYPCLLLPGSMQRPMRLLQPAHLIVAGAGEWLLRTPNELNRVLLLRDRSFWFSKIGALTVVAGQERKSILWLRHEPDYDPVWRRMRVQFNLE